MPPSTDPAAGTSSGDNGGMRTLMFNTKRYDRLSFEDGNRRFGHDIEYAEAKLDPRTADLAAGFSAVCVFVNDDGGAETVGRLADLGVRAIALRCAGYNNVDVEAARAAGIAVVRVPAYSPEAVAEHTLALVLALDRHIPRAYQRVRDGNFALDGLLGNGLHGATVGVVGTGRIGRLVARLFIAFGCEVLAHDPVVDADLVAASVRYVTRDEILRDSDIVALTCPLTTETFHLVNAAAISQMKPGVMIVNTGRGALVDTSAVIEGLKSGRIGSLALDVYEEESPLFFEDRSTQVIADDVFARLLTFPNVLLTAHQAFFTRPALRAIAETTLSNLDDLDAGRACPNQL
jgi:D-lactate dehydrogenase